MKHLTSGVTTEGELKCYCRVVLTVLRRHPNLGCTCVLESSSHWLRHCSPMQPLQRSAAIGSRSSLRQPPGMPQSKWLYMSLGGRTLYYHSTWTDRLTIIKLKISFTQVLVIRRWVQKTTLRQMSARFSKKWRKQRSLWNAPLHGAWFWLTN